MSVQAVLSPVFVMALLTFALIIMLMMARGQAIKAGDVRPNERAPDQLSWPGAADRINNAYGNALAMPTLFYAVVIIALITRKADLMFVVLEWIYVGARIVQAAIYVRGGPIMARGGAFAVSVIVLMIMWGMTAVRILFAAG